MIRMLTMDDVRVGMYFTVFRGELLKNVSMTPEGPVDNPIERKHYNGKVLEVNSVEMPYISFTIHEKMGSISASMDLRSVIIMRISEEYIKSLLPRLKIKKDHFFDEVDKSIKNADTTIKEIFKDL